MQQIQNVLLCHENHRNICNYSMELLGKVQAALLNPTNAPSAPTERCLFLLDVFILAIGVSSGLSSLHPTLDRLTRLSIFPESLALLAERDYWSANIARV